MSCQKQIAANRTVLRVQPVMTGGSFGPFADLVGRTVLIQDPAILCTPDAGVTSRGALGVVQAAQGDTLHVEFVARRGAFSEAYISGSRYVIYPVSEEDVEKAEAIDDGP